MPERVVCYLSVPFTYPSVAIPGILLFVRPHPLGQPFPAIPWFCFPRPKRDHTNPHQNTRGDNDDNPSSAHEVSVSNTAQLQNLFAPHFLAESALQQPNTRPNCEAFSNALSRVHRASAVFFPHVTDVTYETM
jgi:hypothetical protein